MSLPVVRDFVEEVRQKAVGAEVVRGISPDQKFIQVVHEQLVETMGGENAPLAAGGKPGEPSVVLMAGLQGAGKTTATAKLGLHLKEQGRRALLVGADVYRPAAIEQLKNAGRPDRRGGVQPRHRGQTEDIAAAGIEKARAEGFDTVLVDTAGRLQIDQSMMEEMVRIRQACQPDEVLLVVDSMIGQEAAELTRAFHEQVGITGAVLTKLDGDSRGGAALSIRKVSGAPIKFIGTGEKVEALQPFHPSGWPAASSAWGMCSPWWRRPPRRWSWRCGPHAAEAAGSHLRLLGLRAADAPDQAHGLAGGLMKLIPGMNKIDDGMLKQGDSSSGRSRR